MMDIPSGQIEHDLSHTGSHSPHAEVNPSGQVVEDHNSRSRIELLQLMCNCRHVHQYLAIKRLAKSFWPPQPILLQTPSIKGRDNRVALIGPAA